MRGLDPRIRPAALPAILNVLANQPVVDLADSFELVGAQRIERGGRDVLGHLLHVPGARDDRAHARLIDHPAKRELSEADPRIDEPLQLAGGAHTHLEWHAGERLPDVERLTVAVETAM